MKKAFLVGINDYPGSQNDLQGCINDSTNVYDILVKYHGFAAAGHHAAIQQARDEEGNPRRAAEAGRRGARSGDVLVFHYSGHGSQVRDMEGDELKDGKDEIICPWDFDWDGTYIKDDDLAAIFGKLKKGVHLEVILDSCHSGTGTREMLVDRTTIGLAGADRVFRRGPVVQQVVHQATLPGSPSGHRPARRRDLRRRAARPQDRKARGDQPRALGSLQDKPVFGRRGDRRKTVGRLHLLLLQAHQGRGGQGGRSDLLKRVRASLKHEGFSQVPQLECAEKDGREEVFA